jgi:hypothetical protein
MTIQTGYVPHPTDEENSELGFSGQCQTKRSNSETHDLGNDVPCGQEW